MGRSDLFSWRDEADAAEEVARAEAARLEAEKRARFAPHGQVNVRRERLRQATAAALAAEVVLQRIQEQMR